MNRTVSPKQLELTAEKTRDDLLIQALPPHINPEAPAFKADLEKIQAGEKVEAARAVLGINDGGEYEDFNWDNPDNDAIVLTEQRATAAYRNKTGELIIRQRAGALDYDDAFVFIAPENEMAFMEALAKRARE